MKGLMWLVFFGLFSIEGVCFSQTYSPRTENLTAEVITETIQVIKAYRGSDQLEALKGELFRGQRTETIVRTSIGAGGAMVTGAGLALYSWSNERVKQDMYDIRDFVGKGVGAASAAVGAALFVGTIVYVINKNKAMESDDLAVKVISSRENFNDVLNMESAMLVDEALNNQAFALFLLDLAEALEGF